MKTGEFYKLSVISSNLKYVVFINGINVLTFDKDTNYSSSFFINEWLVCGSNSIEIRLIGKDDEVDFTSTIILELFKGDRWDANMRMISTEAEIRYNEFHKKFRPQFRKDFTVNDPRFENAFGAMKVLDLSDTDLLNDFFKEVESLYRLFESGNEERIRPLIEERCSYFDIVYEREPGSTVGEYMTMLKTSLTQDNIMMFKPELLSPSFHFQNRWLTLDYKEFNLPAINMEMADRSIRSYRYYWALNNNDEFYIIR